MQSPKPIIEDGRRLIGLWAADCAERVLPLFETKAPDDTRPREAIEPIRLYARGGKRTALRSIVAAALAAAREVTDPSATAAAQSAGYAAAPAYTKALSPAFPVAPG
jgi:hypothetical protein